MSALAKEMHGFRLLIRLDWPLKNREFRSLMPRSAEMPEATSQFAQMKVESAYSSSVSFVAITATDCRRANWIFNASSSELSFPEG